MHAEILCNLIHCHNKSLKLFMLKFSVSGSSVTCIINTKIRWEKWGAQHANWLEINNWLALWLFCTHTTELLGYWLANLYCVWKVIIRERSVYLCLCDLNSFHKFTSLSLTSQRFVLSIYIILNETVDNLSEEK